MILSKIGTLHKLEYLFLWKYFKKQVVFCRKRFLCCATVSICCAVFTANRTTIRLYFSRLYPHVGGGIHPSRGPYGSGNFAGGYGIRPYGVKGKGAIEIQWRAGHARPLLGRQ